MVYGFDEATKEKVPIYSKNDSYLLETDNDWVVHKMFEEELLLCTNRMAIQGIPEGGAPPTEIPANSTLVGRIILPHEFITKYENENEVWESITLSMFNHFPAVTEISPNQFSRIVKIVNNFYLYVVVTNKTAIATPFPSVDISIIARPYVSPGPV